MGRAERIAREMFREDNGSMRDDEEYARLALTSNIAHLGVFKVLSERLRNDPSIVELALNSRFDAFRWCGPSLMCDRDYMLQMAIHRPIVMAFELEIPWCRDRSFVLQAVRCCAETCNPVVPRGFRDDAEILLAALSNQRPGVVLNTMNWHSFCTSPELCENDSFMRSALATVSSPYFSCSIPKSRLRTVELRLLACTTLDDEKYVFKWIDAARRTLRRCRLERVEVISDALAVLARNVPYARDACETLVGDVYHPEQRMFTKRYRPDWTNLADGN